MYRKDTKEIFKYPTLFLKKDEYAKIISEINNNYHNLYENNDVIIHYSLGTDGRYYEYFVEIHGFNNYNVFAKFIY